MRKFLIGGLAALSCFSCFAACGGDEDKTDKTNLTAAKARVEALYGDTNVKTRTDYSLENGVTVDGIVYSLSWSVDVATGVTLTNEKGKTTVDVAEDLTADLPYLLTGMIVAPNESSTTVVFNRTVAKAPQVLTTAPASGDTFTLYIYEEGADIFFDGGLENNTLLSTTTDYAKGVEVTAEAVSGKENVFYLTFTQPNGTTKQYIGAQNIMISGTWETGLYYSYNKKGAMGANASFEWSFDEQKGIFVATIAEISLGVVGSTQTYTNVPFAMQYENGKFTAINLQEATSDTFFVKAAK